jgi:hypothetical protein
MVKKRIAMEKVSAVITLFFLIVATAQAEVYQYINEQGKVAYTDVKRPDAKKVILPPLTTYAAPKDIAASEDTANDGSAPEDVGRVEYQSLNITSPEADGTLRRHLLNRARVQYVLQPALQEQDKVVLYVDNNKREGLGIGDLERGGHSLRLEVVDSEGVLQKTSQEVNFTVQQVSKLLSPAFKANQ